MDAVATPLAGEQCVAVAMVLVELPSVVLVLHRPVERAGVLLLAPSATDIRSRTHARIYPLRTSVD